MKFLLLKWVLISLLGGYLLAGSAYAQVLSRCAASNGAVSWQSAPCAQGTRTLRRVSYAPETSIALAAPERTDRTPADLARATRSDRASTRRIRTKPDTCAKARERREATLERVGLKRNYELLSKLDADVRQVCR